MRELAEKIASLPYDVMDTEEARGKIAGNQYSFLTVTKSEATLPQLTPVEGPYYRWSDFKARFGKVLI